MTRIWVITAKPAHAADFERGFGCGVFVLDREPTRHIVVRKDNGQSDMVYRIKAVTIQNGNYEDDFDIFVYMANCEPVDLKQAEETVTPARIAAQELPRPVTGFMGAKSGTQPVTRCVVCGNKMKPRKGKIFCSPKCKMAHRRQQLPIPESDSDD